MTAATATRPRVRKAVVGPRIAEQRAKGRPIPEVAAALGLPVHIICHHAPTPAQHARTAGLIRFADLAADLKVDRGALYKAVKRLKIKPKVYGRHRMLTYEQGERLRLYFAEKIDKATAAKWIDADEAARRLKVTKTTFLKCLAEARPPYDKIKKARVTMAKGNVVRYDPETILPITSAMPVRPDSVPTGHFSSRQVAALLGLTPKAVNMWGQVRGAPSGQTITGAYYFKPATLIAWLRAHKTPHMRGYAIELEKVNVST